MTRLRDSALGNDKPRMVEMGVDNVLGTQRRQRLEVTVGGFRSRCEAFRRAIRAEDT